jgi:N-acetylglutamate synthase
MSTARARLAWRVEQTEMNAWPALGEIFLGDWLVRFAGGMSRRANSVNPLVADAVADDALIAACEAHYRRRRMPPIFRVATLLDPVTDRRLAARGYTAEGETVTLYGAIAGVAAGPDADVRLSPRPDPAWCAAMARLQGHSAAEARTYRRIARRIAIPAAFAALVVDGSPAALAYGALHDGLMCFESVVTDPAQRRRGHARRLLTRLALWGKNEGATGACLQVQADNAPAIPLYHSLGLETELYRYHYRRAPPTAA